MLNFLSDIVLYPVSLIIEVLYLTIFRISHNTGITILGVSIGVSLITLPLYNKAESWQKADRSIKNRLKKKVDGIKAVFKGDERMMILSTYYRQNDYHPIQGLKGSAGLLLQIPFFIAAYAFLNNNPALLGQRFFFIKDLSQADGLLAGINLLPIIMTIINIISSSIYAIDYSRNEKIQLYAIAAVFLVLLYNSPSGLVLYWTFNNIFSLGKNLAFRFKKPGLFLYFPMLFASLAASFSVIFIIRINLKKAMVVIALTLFLVAIPIIKMLYSRFRESLDKLKTKESEYNTRIFLASCAVLVLCLGLFVPASMISSSPQEFSFISKVDHPLYFIFRTLSQGVGMFLIWPFFIYTLIDKDKRYFPALLLASISAIVVVNVFFWSGNYGRILPTLFFSNRSLLTHTRLQDIINILVAVMIVLAVWYVFKKAWHKEVFLALVLLAVAQSGFGIIKGVEIHSGFKKLVSMREKEGVQAEQLHTANDTIEPVFSLSQEGHNVMLFMLDKALGGVIPEMVSREEDIARALEGFSYFPNTLSHGGHTIPGAPAIFGGYEYTPTAMNERKSETLLKKHNESLTVLPLLFSNNGWDITLSDASLANYSTFPDNSIFDEYEEFTAFNLEGRYTELWLERKGIELEFTSTLEKNLFRFSLFKAAPYILREEIYDGGDWWDSMEKSDSFYSFARRFSVMDFLPELVEFTNSRDSFIYLANNTTHEERYLNYPEYEPRLVLEDKGYLPYNNEEANMAYHVATGVLKCLGRLFEKMKENGVWDNTRIVIVSDHGFTADLPQFNGFPRSLSPSVFNALLLYKDFNSTGEMITDMRFGTNGDVPAMLCEDLVESKNPFTGKDFKMHTEGEPVKVLIKGIDMPGGSGKKEFDFTEKDLMYVTDNIFDYSNWRSKK